MAFDESRYSIQFERLKALDKPFSYEQVSLAYFDILGFKSLVEREGTRDPGPILKLFYALTMTVSAPSPEPIHSFYLSDSIVMWTTTEIGEVWMLKMVEYSQALLLYMGYLVRGAIVNGSHLSLSVLKTDSSPTPGALDYLMASPALVKAVSLEKKIRAPIISVESEIVKRVQTKEKETDFPPVRFAKWRRHSILDGYFSQPAIMNLKKQLTERGKLVKLEEWDLLIEDALHELVQIRFIIRDALRSRRASVREKWLFIKRRFEREVGQLERIPNGEFLKNLKLGHREDKFWSSEKSE